MIFRASDFRYCHVLPDPTIEKVAESGKKIKAIRFLPGMCEEKKWWIYERFIEIDFESDNWDVRAAAQRALCDWCKGACCKNIPTHNIGIYLSRPEIVKIQKRFPHLKYTIDADTQGKIEVMGYTFYIVSVKRNGDCVFLGDNGCVLGDLKPIWCQIYYCEMFQGQDTPYRFINQIY